MKNFKKVLALVLAVATVLSFAAVASAAQVSFTDANEFKKTEAISTLAMLGVLQGYEDGTFKATGDVTRAQLAKIICTVMNFGKDVNDQYKGACTFTDAADNWAAGYIAYCAQEKIIAGKNATTFKPNDNVTGVEAAKMLLVALGYDPDQCGFTGSAWASNVLSTARKTVTYEGITNPYTLLDNLDDVNLTAPLNRENTAQMVLNALKLPVVYFEGGTSITTGGTTIKVDAQAKVTARAETLTGFRCVVTDGMLDFGEKYFEGLSVYEGQADPFGHTGNIWSYKGEEVGPFAQAAALTYKGPVSGATLYNALGRPKFGVNAVDTVTMYIDGTYTLVYDELHGWYPGYVGHLPIISPTETEGYFGATGAETEVFVSEDGTDINIVVKNYYAACVRSYVAPTTDSNGVVIKEGYITIGKIDDAEDTVILGKAAYSDGTYVPADNSFLTDAFTREDALNKTIVVFTKGYDTVQGKHIAMSVDKAKSVTETVTGISGNIALGYTVSTSSGNLTVSDNCCVTLSSAMIGQTVPFYKDPLGNVLYTTAIASNDYVYILNIAYGTSALGTEDTTHSTIKAEVVLSDGTYKVVDLDGNTVKAINAEVLATYGSITQANLARLCAGRVASYVVNGDGTFALYALVDTDGAIGQQAFYKTPATGNKFVITAGSPYMVEKNAQGTTVQTLPFVSNASTTFVMETQDANGNFVYTAYTGLTAVPNMTVGTKLAVINGLDGVVATVFAIGAEPDVVSTAAVGMLYKNPGYDAITAVTGVAGIPTRYYSVNAVIDGQVTTAKVAESLYQNLSTGANLFNTCTLDADGYYLTAELKTTAATGSLTKTYYNFAKDAEGNITGTYANGVITLEVLAGERAYDSYFVTSSLPVYVFNTSTRLLSQQDITSFYDTNVKNGSVIVLFDANQKLTTGAAIPAAIYITVDPTQQPT